jgi:hypothetical protein
MRLCSNGKTGDALEEDDDLIDFRAFASWPA